MRIFLAVVAAIVCGATVANAQTPRRISGWEQDSLRGPVKRITTYSMPAEYSGDYDESAQMISSVMYDTRGNVTDSITPYSHASYHYNERGYPVTYEHAWTLDADAEEPSRMEYRYDISGRLVEQISEANISEWCDTMRYRYDDAGKLVERIYTPKGSLCCTKTFREVFFYNPQGQLQRTDVYRSDTLHHQIYEHYDTVWCDTSASWAQRPLIITTTLSSKEEWSRPVIRSCRDSRGRLVWQWRREGQCIGFSTVLSLLDSTGHVVEEITKPLKVYIRDSLTGPGNKPMLRWLVSVGPITYNHAQFAYDRHGNRIRQVDPSGWSSPTTITYIYDDHGNWTRAEWKERRKELILRDIEYYPPDELPMAGGNAGLAPSSQSLR